MDLTRKTFVVALHFVRRPPFTVQKFQMATKVPIDFSSLPDHRSLVIEKRGLPKDSVILKTRRPEEVILKELGSKQVLVEHLAACINPSDISLIRGHYFIRPRLPAIIGNEGVIRVKSIGSEVTHVKPGDLVLGVSMIGYWQSYSVQNSDDLFKVDNDLDISIAAQLKVNPCTAYRMMKDFYNLQRGDTIIQNGANSALGIYAIQLAKLWGYQTINIIRDRPNKEEVVKALLDFGADYVLTDAEVTNIEVMSEIMRKTGKPKLFLDCVAGQTAVHCQQTLDEGGYWVSYAAMSSGRNWSATSLMRDETKHVGFWMSSWYQKRIQSRRQEIVAMLDEVGAMFKQNALRPKSTTLIDFEDRNAAFSGSSDTKYLFLINK